LDQFGFYQLGFCRQKFSHSVNFKTDFSSGNASSLVSCSWIGWDFVSCGWISLDLVSWESVTRNLVTVNIKTDFISRMLPV
jgi:hypothetical protein